MKKMVAVLAVFLAACGGSIPADGVRIAVLACGNNDGLMSVYRPIGEDLVHAVCGNGAQFRELHYK